VVHGASVIGDDVVLRQGVTLGMRDMTSVNSAPNIGSNVDIGAGAKILGPVHVGNGAAIGANAVVLEDVPPGGLAVGVPARVIDASKRKKHA
jgi:serine O-acetyltransferase